MKPSVLRDGLNMTIFMFHIISTSTAAPSTGLPLSASDKFHHLFKAERSTESLAEERGGADKCTASKWGMLRVQGNVSNMDIEHGHIHKASN
jgi:hypothetical protein